MGQFVTIDGQLVWKNGDKFYYRNHIAATETKKKRTIRNNTPPGPSPKPPRRQPSKTNKPLNAVNITYGKCKIPGSHRKMPFEAIDGSGACMFRSLVQAAHVADHGVLLSKKDETQEAGKLRDLVVSYVKDRPTVYKSIWQPAMNMSLAEYVRHMKKRRTFGDNLELQLASVVMRRPICVTSGRSAVDIHHRPAKITPLKSPLYLHLWNPDSEGGAHYTPYIPRQ